MLPPCSSNMLHMFMGTSGNINSVSVLTMSGSSVGTTVVSPLCLYRQLMRAKPLADCVRSRNQVSRSLTQVSRLSCGVELKARNWKQVPCILERGGNVKGSLGFRRQKLQLFIFLTRCWEATTQKGAIDASSGDPGTAAYNA